MNPGAGEQEAARALRVLIIEDSPDDAELMARMLRRAGYDVQYRRVETVQAIAQALDEGDWDVFIADYALPGLSGLDALRLVQERGLDVPLVVVSGAISDEAAVAAMKSGAHDYVFKQNLARLVPAISRELREARLRREQHRVRQELEALNEQSGAELRQSRDQLAVILSGIAEGIIAEDEEHIIYVNDTGARLLGYSSVEEVTGADRTEVMRRIQIRDEEGRPIAESELTGPRAIAERRGVESVLKWLNPRGDSRYYIVASTPYFDERRRVWTAITIFRDITERRQAEASAQFLADASETLGASIDFEATAAALAMLVAPQLCDWSVVDLAGNPLAAAHVEPEKRELVLSLAKATPEVWRLRPPARQTLLHTALTERLLRDVKEPEVRALARSLSPESALIVPLAVGGARGYMAFVRSRADWPYTSDDMRLAEEIARRGSLALENARLYRKAREAIEARDEFLSIASHELRTPLTTLTLQLQRLQQLERAGDRVTPDLSWKVSQAVRQAQRLAGLIDTLLDVSRVTGGRLELQREELDLAELLRQLTERLAEDALRAGCKLTLEVKGDLHGVWDRLRLEQVVTNLLSNAFKYGAGRSVELAARGDEDCVEVSVSDHGIGLAPEHMGRVFQRFERAVSSRHYGGLGLGLFIVQQIVNGHSGSTRVKSAPGQGATFTVSLPRRADSVACEVAQSDPAQPSRPAI